ncbi:MAG: hypothetical protein HRF40_02755 [Nitrososphaera sp.]
MNLKGGIATYLLGLPSSAPEFLAISKKGSMRDTGMKHADQGNTDGEVVTIVNSRNAP